MESLARTANRGSVSTGYDIDYSCKFERANNEQIFTSNAAAGNRKTWTFSAWIKRTELSQDYHCIFSCGYSNIQIMANDRPRLVLYDGTSYYADPEMLMRDTAAWYHIVVQVDTTQSTAADRVKWWINGDRVTAFNNSTYTNMSQNDDFDFGRAGSGSGAWLRLGDFFGGSEGFSGYMSDVYYLNGTAEDADAFGETDSDSGIWIPKKYTGSGYGTQGFKYEFKDSSALGTDTSGEGHNANNLSNITAADQATDTPTNNFCTLNPIFNVNSTVGNLTISEGSTRAVNAESAYKSATSTIGPSNGKWYWEVNITDRNTITTIGVTMPYYWLNGNIAFSGTVYYGQTGQRHNNSVAGGGQDSFGNGYTDGDIISFALDMDAATPTLAVRKNNSLVTGNNAAGNLMYDLSLTGSSGTFLPPKEDGYFAKLVGYGANTFDINFGGYTAASISSAASDENGYGTFEYAPPSGYYAICTKNLAEYG